MRRRYITKIYDTGNEDTLNLYDVSGLAHFELYRALGMAGDPSWAGGQSIDYAQGSEEAAGRGDYSVWKRCMGIRHSLAIRRHYIARRGPLGNGERTLLSDHVEQLQHARAEMAGQHPRREFMGIVVHRGRRYDVPQLHPAPGGEPGGRARWNIRRHADFVGCSFGRPGQRGNFGHAAGNDSLSGERQ